MLAIDWSTINAGALAALGDAATGPRVRAAALDTWDSIRQQTERTAHAVYDWIGELVGEFVAVLELVQIVYEVPVFMFATAQDERTCPECAPLDGLSSAEDGPGLPIPPLHGNCRCLILRAGSEYRIRWDYEWRWQWVEWWEFREELTGWEWW